MAASPGGASADRSARPSGGEIPGLYCADRNGRWHQYGEADPTVAIQTLLEEVTRDETGI
ncbi:MAG: DUF3024 domain-containing protein [Elusimicrobiota bacterium]